MKVMIIPGNDNTDVSENWYPYVKKGLEKIGLEVIAKNMPDPKLARREYWIPFIEKQLNGDEDAILIGHSSGAVAVMRYLESHKVKGAILIGACYTDLGMEEERTSGYYDEPWQWNKMKDNADWIVIFASTDDPFVPISEPRFIKNNLEAEYNEYFNQGHFGADIGKKEFPEIVQIIKDKLKIS